MVLDVRADKENQQTTNSIKSAALLWRFQLQLLITDVQMFPCLVSMIGHFATVDPNRTLIGQDWSPALSYACLQAIAVVREEEKKKAVAKVIFLWSLSHSLSFIICYCKYPKVGLCCSSYILDEACDVITAAIHLCYTLIRTDIRILVGC